MNAWVQHLSNCQHTVQGLGITASWEVWPQRKVDMPVFDACESNVLIHFYCSRWYIHLVFDESWMLQVMDKLLLSFLLIYKISLFSRFHFPLCSHSWKLVIKVIQLESYLLIYVFFKIFMPQYFYVYALVCSFNASLYTWSSWYVEQFFHFFSFINVRLYCSLEFLFHDVGKIFSLENYYTWVKYEYNRPSNSNTLTSIYLGAIWCTEIIGFWLSSSTSLLSSDTSLLNRTLSPQWSFVKLTMCFQLATGKRWMMVCEATSFGFGYFVFVKLWASVYGILLYFGTLVNEMRLVSCTSVLWTSFFLLIIIQKY